ncbi:MAG: hypothetical protein AAF389_09550 [Gemmatimonadota bacterium]
MARPVEPREGVPARGVRVGAERVLGVPRVVLPRLGRAERVLRSPLSFGRTVVGRRFSVGRERGAARVVPPRAPERVVDGVALLGTRRGNADEGRLAGPSRVVRPTETGVLPVRGVVAAGRPPERVGVAAPARRSPPRRVALGRRALSPPRVAAPTSGARRFTDVVARGRDVA